MLKEHPNEPHQSITSWLTLLDRQDAQNASRNLSIELFLVEIFLLRSMFSWFRWFITAEFLYLAQSNDKLARTGRCAVGFAEDAADRFAQRRCWSFVWYGCCG